ncbi:MAG TPA: hypothetical protein VFC15_10520, partial [Candidatus Limnocylindrales bacterium]|nr:hypothetical protein [Candidatus Limnocylindrales bacterium]
QRANQCFKYREGIFFREQRSGRGISRFVSAKRVLGSGDLLVEGYAVPGVPKHAERVPRSKDRRAAGAVDHLLFEFRAMASRSSDLMATALGLVIARELQSKKKGNR